MKNHVLTSISVVLAFGIFISLSFGYVFAGGVNKENSSWFFSPQMKVDKVISLGSEKGNMYVIGDDISSSSPVTGDVYSISKFLRIQDRVSGDINSVGMNLSASGAVDGDIRAVGQTLAVENVVAGEILFVGESFLLAESGEVKKGAFITANTVDINGPIQGDVRISGNDVTIKSTINGNVYIKSNIISIHPSAVITGTITYEAEERMGLNIMEGATVGGTAFVEKRGKGGGKRIPFPIEGIMFFLALGLLSYWLVRNCFNEHLSKSKKAINIFINIVVGMVTPVILLVLAVLSFVVIPGLSLIGLFFLFSIFVLIFLSIILSPIPVGIFAQYIYNKNTSLTLYSTLAGAGILFIFSQIFFLGYILMVTLSFFIMGIIARKICACLFPQKN